MIWTNRAFFDSPIYFGHSIIKHIFIWCTSTYSFKCLCSFCSIFHWLSRQKLRHFFCCYFLGILIRTNSRAVYSFQIIFFPSYATCHFNLAFLCSHTPPPSRPKFGKNLNLDIFEIIAPSLTLAKTVPKSYLTFTLGLIQLYISQIWSKCCPYLTNISPIYHQNKGHISVILIWEKVQTPLPHQKAVYILNCGLFDFWHWPPHFGLFPQFCDILSFECIPYLPPGFLSNQLFGTFYHNFDM